MAEAIEEEFGVFTSRFFRSITLETVPEPDYYNTSRKQRLLFLDFEELLNIDEEDEDSEVDDEDEDSEVDEEDEESEEDEDEEYIKNVKDKEEDQKDEKDKKEEEETKDREDKKIEEDEKDETNEKDKDGKHKEEENETEKRISETLMEILKTEMKHAGGPVKDLQSYKSWANNNSGIKKAANIGKKEEKNVFVVEYFHASHVQKAHNYISERNDEASWLAADNKDDHSNDETALNFRTGNILLSIGFIFVIVASIFSSALAFQSNLFEVSFCNATITFEDL